MECSDYDPEFRLSSAAGCTLGSFPAGPDRMYAFLLAHCAEIPALSREARKRFASPPTFPAGWRATWPGVLGCPGDQGVA
jgi:hypothetical protein